MDYDKTEMPAAYDAGRAYSPRVLQTWLATIEDAASGQSIEHILDLGCGTGRFSFPLADRFSARVTGIDPSEKMLAEARKKARGNVHFMRGAAEEIPLTDGSVDLVFMSMVLHHFADPRQAARECHRVLRAGGLVCLRAGAKERIDDYPYTRFFPEAHPILGSTLVTAHAIEEIFVTAGFALQLHKIVDSEVAASWPAYAEKVAYRADSILSQLSDPAFARGLLSLREFADRAAPGPVIEPVDFFAFTRLENKVPG